MHNRAEGPTTHMTGTLHALAKQAGSSRRMAARGGGMDSTPHGDGKPSRAVAQERHWKIKQGCRRPSSHKGYKVSGDTAAMVGTVKVINAMGPSGKRPTTRNKKLELKLESMLWRFRLVAIVPVVMSLTSTLITFAIGTREIFNSLMEFLFHGSAEDAGKHILAGLVTGIDFYLIGLALLIFGYGIYELLISEIDIYREQAHIENSNGLLDIRNLDELKQKLVKVLIVALIVTAFKSMISMPLKDVQSLLTFSVALALIALSGFLISVKLPGKA